MSRKTIGESPFDTLVAPKEETREETKPVKALNGNGSQKPTSPTNNKQRLTVQISEDVIERAKNAVYWTRGLTLAQLTEEALEKAIKGLEKSSVIYDDSTEKPLKEKGEVFPKRKENLKSGRPVK